ncbi:MAG: hypothetical protein IJW93_06970 [Clostridia bacterium]|nr:hypothetical protein [Clostridia bacterium]
MPEKQEMPPADGLQAIFRALEKQVPDKAKVEIQKEKPAVNKVSEYNKAIIETYLKSENTHLEQQKTVGIIIAVCVVLQLITFNVLIYLVTLGNYDLERTQALLDFMKYYTGAVIVEMLGLCLVVVNGVYSKSIEKMAGHILKKK